MLQKIRGVLKKRYDPTKYYLDVENGPFCPDCQTRHNTSHIEQVIIGSAQGTTFPTKVGTSVYNALIDTGVTHMKFRENPGICLVLAN